MAGLRRRARALLFLGCAALACGASGATDDAAAPGHAGAPAGAGERTDAARLGGQLPGRRLDDSIADARRTSQEACPDPDDMECKAMNPPPTDNVRVVFCVLWALWAIGLSVFLTITFFMMTGSGFDTSTLISGAITNLIEGVFFLFRATYYATRNPVYMFPCGMAVQFFSGAGLWFTAYALFFYGRGWNKSLVAIVALSIGGALSLSYTILLQTGYFLAGQSLFVPWFEFAQLFLLSNIISILGTVEGERANATCQFLVGFSLMFGVHIAGMGLLALDKDSLEQVFFPFQIIGQMVGSLTLTLALVRMIELGVFNDRSHEVIQFPQGILARLYAEREARDAQKVGDTRLVSPERIWSVGVVFVLLGYGISTLMLFTVAMPRMKAEGRDLMDVDPVLRLYGTLHPCILLDYLPGTLFAQPLFDLSVIISQVSAGVSLVRAALFGDLFILGVFALMFGVYMPCSCMFQLVFTFNPTHTSVLLHSVPYMLDNISKGVYCSCTAYAVWKWPQLVFREQVHCTFACVCYTLAIIYGTFFMSSKLMSNAGLGGDGLNPNTLFEDAAGLSSNPANQDLEVKVDPGPLIMTLSAQFLLFSLGWTSPLRGRPLAFEVRCWESGVPVELSADPPGAHAIQETQRVESATFASATGGFGNRLRLLAKRPLTFAMITIAAVMYSAKWLGKQVYGEQVDDWDYHDKFTTQPSATFVAVGWIVVLQFLVAHVVLAVTYEHRNNCDCWVRWVVYISGLLLVSTGVCAHAGTIPHAPDWFRGPEAFLVALALWIFKDVLLLQQLLCRVLSASREHGLAVVVGIEIGMAVIAGLSILGTAFAQLVEWYLGSTRKMPDIVWIVSVVLYSMFDVRKVEIILSNVRIADQVDLLGTHYFKEWTDDLKEVYNVVPVHETESLSAADAEYLKNHVSTLPEAVGDRLRTADSAGYTGLRSQVPPGLVPPQQPPPGGLMQWMQAPRAASRALERWI